MCNLDIRVGCRYCCEGPVIAVNIDIRAASKLDAVCVGSDYLFVCTVGFRAAVIEGVRACQSLIFICKYRYVVACRIREINCIVKSAECTADIDCCGRTVRSFIGQIDSDRIASIEIPDINWYGDETITFFATDPEGGSDNDFTTFTVNPINDPPIVSGIPDQIINEGETFTTINLDNYVTDIDNSASELIWTYSGNTDLTIDITNRIATITIPHNDWFGEEKTNYEIKWHGFHNGFDDEIYAWIQWQLAKK